MHACNVGDAVCGVCAEGSARRRDTRRAQRRVRKAERKGIVCVWLCAHCVVLLLISAYHACRSDAGR
jgi:hypothetical protein